MNVSLLRSTALVFILGPAYANSVSAGSITPFLFSDQTEDAIYLAADRNNDGDAQDRNEVQVFFDASNASGLVAPTDNVFTLTIGEDNVVYAGDGDTDTVYKLVDLNNDGDAQDAGEAMVWFSSANAEGRPLLTPNGSAIGPDGAVYIVEADTVGTPNGDFVYRTEDLNNDGDAEDPGESSIWLDLKALNASSSPFEIAFDGETAYIIDSVGGDPDVVYTAQDSDDSGSIDNSEITSLIDDNNAFGVPLDFALDVHLGTVFVYELFDFAGDQSLYALNDLNDNGVIDDLGELAEVWNNSLLQAPYESFAGFSLAVSENGDVLLTSNGGDATEDLLIYLTDLNNDMDYLDPDETLLVLSRDINGALPVRARAVGFYGGALPATIPLPAGLPLLLTAIAAGAFLRRYA